MVVLALTGAALAAIAKPSIRNFAPLGGKPSTKLTITGKNLKGATAVKVAGVKLAFKVNSTTKITATVSGKPRTGRITVTTKGGTALSVRAFTVNPVPIPVPVTPTTNYPPNGLGSLTASPTSVGAGSTGNTIVFTFTAGTGGMSNGSIAISVPAGWTPPVTTAAAGCVASSGGTSAVISTSGQDIYFIHLTLAAGASATVTYGAKSGNSFSGATCTANGGVTAPTAPGANTFNTRQKSTDDTTSAGGTLTPISGSPVVTVT